MSQFDGTLFDESLFGDGSLVVASGAARGRGASTARPHADYSHAASLRGHGNTAAAPLRATPSAALLCGKSMPTGAAVRLRLAVAFALAGARAEGRGRRTVHGSGHAMGMTRLAGASSAAYAAAGTLLGAGATAATILQLRLPPPSRAGIRIATWLRPGT